MSRWVVGISTTRAGVMRPFESQLPISSDRYLTLCVAHFPLLSSLRCNVPSSLLCARYPAASHAAGQMASRCNLLSAVCSVFWMRDGGKEKSSVKFSLYSACFPSLKAGRRIIAARQVGERTIFPPSAECWQVCGQTDLQIVFVVPGATGWTHVDALLVMEIEFCAELPQGQVTSRIFNVLFRKFHRSIFGCIIR